MLYDRVAELLSTPRSMEAKVQEKIQALEYFWRCCLVPAPDHRWSDWRGGLASCFFLCLCLFLSRVPCKSHSSPKLRDFNHYLISKR